MVLIRNIRKKLYVYKLNENEIKINKWMGYGLVLGFYMFIFNFWFME